MKLHRIYLLFTLIIPFHYSCQSDDDTTGITEMPVLLDTQFYGVWRYENITITPEADYNDDGRANSNLLVEMRFCLKDDLFVLNTDNTYTIIDEGITCDNDERNFPITSGVFETGVFPVKDLRLEIREPSSLFSVNFFWNNMKVLEDSNKPNKRFLQFTITNENILGLGDSNFSDGTEVVVTLVSDK